MKRISRRQVLLGSAGLAATIVGGRVLQQQLKSAEAGHNLRFQQLATTLDRAGIARPVIVIDRETAKQNLKTLLSRVRPDYQFRIVAKSLPSMPLLAWLMKEAKTDRLMLFHEPFLRIASEAFPDSDILMGKPQPVAAARAFYQQRHPASNFRPEKQLQWLIDRKKRLEQYANLAEMIDQSIRVSIEINLGLGRGGVDEPKQLRELLDIITSHPLLEFGGLMGYEAHIAKAPGGQSRHFRLAMARYQRFVDEIKVFGGFNSDQLTLNAGGSTTYALYEGEKVAPNELAVGSAILQPTDFDLPTLKDHRPAAFIATPVLKSSVGLNLPGVPGLGTLMGLWNQQYQKTLFIDGGYWKAKPVSPQGLIFNSLYGRSSNQEMLNGPAELELEVDDWVFLRPTQSESVLLQFGDLLIYDANEKAITERWAPFHQASNSDQ